GVAVREPAPLSFAQQRLWFLEQLEPGSAFYNIPEAVAVDGPLRLPALAAAVTELVRRHGALRTVFGDLAGRPYQKVLPAVDVPLPEVDLAALSGGRAESSLEALVRE